MSLLIILFTYFIMLLLLAGIFLAMPYLTRKNVSFGIGIPKSHYDSAEVKAIRRSYVAQGLIVSIFIVVLTVILSLFLPFNDAAVILATPAMLLMLIAFGAIYLRAYYKMKQLKSASSWISEAREVIVIDTTLHKSQHMMSPLWFLSYFAVILTNVSVVLYYYDTIPNKLPMKFNFDGTVSRYAEKSTGSLLAMPLTELFIALMFIFVYWMISKSKLQLDPENPELSAIQTRKYLYRWSAFSIFSGLGMILSFALMQYFMYRPTPNLMLAGLIPLFISAGVILFIVFLAFTTGQSGNRIKPESDENSSSTTVFRDDDQFWKLGSIYFNKNDPSIFIEKRFGIGWTINFARPLAWLILIGFILLTLLFSNFISSIA